MSWFAGAGYVVDMNVFSWFVRYGDSVDNTVENSSIFSIRMYWLSSGDM